MIRLAALAGLAALVATSACIIHLDRNAPGVSNIARPPETVRPHHSETPEDPGENILIVSAGGFTGGGVRAGKGSARGVFEAGAEISVDHGVLERSHQRPTLLPMTPLPPSRKGLTFGMAIIESPVNDSSDTELGPIYLEAHAVDLFHSFSAGYSYDLRDQSHGPQVSASVAGLYGKASYRFGRGFDATFGIVVKLPTGIVWSR